MEAPAQRCRSDRVLGRPNLSSECGRAKVHAAAAPMVRSMAKIFLNHPIGDYDTWRPVFDADAARREAAGMTNVSVLRDVDDPSSIWLVGDGDPDKVNEMMQDPELAAAMQQAGVTGPPQVYIAT
jgi:hypothetical protein